MAGKKFQIYKFPNYLSKKKKIKNVKRWNQNKSIKIKSQ